MVNCKFKSALVGVAILVLNTSSAAAQEWTRFRGPNGTGESEATLPATWTDADDTWKVELPGIGHSSPVVWGKRIFLASALDDGRIYIRTQSHLYSLGK